MITKSNLITIALDAIPVNTGAPSSLPANAQEARGVLSPPDTTPAAVSLPRISLFIQLLSRSYLIKLPSPVDTPPTNSPRKITPAIPKKFIAGDEAVTAR